MAVFKCKMCGGTLEIENGASVGVCEYCGTKQTIPKLDDEKRANLYDRANHFRRNNEFDKAMGIYEQILNEDSTDAEAYWSLVLCRYGIEYVEEPSTHRRIPTVNRAQFTSIYEDDNYKSALKNADGAQREVYEAEAKEINEIQKGILAISQKEEPFDVFICYKETDANGRRTQDSVLATDLYHQLTQEGFKVFFSRITLEDKLGTAYEPYIFAALNSAKVMVVLGTKPEHFTATWVKNEWSRYLGLVRQSAGKKILIPAYRDMDPYDLPEEFSHLQAQDMSKLGFMQDLVRGIKKLVGTEQTAGTARAAQTEAASAGNAASTRALIERMYLFLEDRNWSSAAEYSERILDLEPKNAEAYLGKLMVELCVPRKEELGKVEKNYSDSINFQKAVKFADGSLREQMENYLTSTNRIISANNEMVYEEALKLVEGAKEAESYSKAIKLLDTIPNYENASELRKECLEKLDKKSRRKKGLIWIIVGVVLIAVGFLLFLLGSMVSMLLLVCGFESLTVGVLTSIISTKKIKRSIDDRLKKIRDKS